MTTMSDMGKHTTLVNGHRGEDGSAVAAPVVKPFVIPRAWPLSGQLQAAAPDVKADGLWQNIKSWFRVIFTHRGWLAAVPVVLVNAVAFGAQLGFWRAHVPLVAEAVLVALALESIAVYLAWQAHLAQLADDAALRLRLSAYGMAILIGVLNFSHYMKPGWRPTVEAVTFGMMSAISPWLWSVHSRRVSRDALKVKGLIEPHAVRLGGTRWAWHFIRSVRVMSAATWTGETDPAAAIAAWQPRKARNTSPVTSPEPQAPASPDAAEVTPASPSPDDVKPVTVTPRKRAMPPSARAEALALLRDNPGMGDAEVMKRTKASKSTVERARKDLAKETL